MDNTYPVEVTVIIPVYNCQPYVEATLQSLCEQDFHSYEVIVVDDGSTDSTAQKVRHMERAFQGHGLLRYVWQQNGGAARARNRGIELAQGRYLLFVDADDLFAPNMISCLYQAAQAGDADVVVGNAVAFGSTRDDVLHAIPGHVGLSEGTYQVDGVMRKRLFQTFCAHPWDKLIRADLVRAQSLRFQALHHSNDTRFVLLAMALAKRIGVVDQTITYYRVGTEASTRDTTAKDPLCDLVALDSLRSMLQEKRSLDESLRRSLDNMCLDVCVRVMVTLAAVSLEAAQVFANALYHTYEPKWQLDRVGFPYIYSFSRFLSYRRMRHVTPAGLCWACATTSDMRQRGGRSALEKLALGLRLVVASMPFLPYRRHSLKDEFLPPNATHTGEP